MRARTMSVAVVVAVVVNLWGALGQGQAQNSEVAAVPWGQGIAWQIAVPFEGASLRVSGSSGIVVDQEFSGGSAPSLPGGGLPDGNYQYEVWVFPTRSPAMHQAMAAAWATGESQDPPAEVGAPPAITLSGSFSVERGAVVLHDRKQK